jgi:uncharacterized protein
VPRPEFTISRVTASVHSILDSTAQPPVRGFLHVPEAKGRDGIVLTHGAGSDCRSRLLTELADALSEAGLVVLRCDLPYRQKRPHGPPFPGSAADDREGLRRAVEVIKQHAPGITFLGGHSYGGRQGSILAAEGDDLASGLLLLSYPLHPPLKPAELRTGHFARLRTPALFVHGAKDPFASEQELLSALELIPARTRLMEIEGAGHDLLSRKSENGVPARIAQEFLRFFQT